MLPVARACEPESCCWPAGQLRAWFFLPTMLLRGLLLLAVALAAAAAAGDQCTLAIGCGYSKGSREHAAATSQGQCCELCAARPGCAAGVFGAVRQLPALRLPSDGFS